MRLIISVLLCLLFPAPAAVVLTRTFGNFTLEFEKTAPLPGRGIELMSSQDGWHTAYATSTARGMVFMVDGKPGPDFKGVSIERFQFSPDGTRHAYLATNESGLVAVVDGNVGPVFDEIRLMYDETPRPFSPDSSRVAYTGRKGAKWQIVVDGVGSKAWDEIRWHHFSTNGARLGYRAKLGADYYAIVDGKEHGPFRSEGNILFSPDGKRVAFVSHVRVDGKDRFAAVLDGKSHGPYDVVWPYSMAFSADSEHFGFLAGSGRQFFVIVNGKVVDTRAVKDEFGGFLHLSEEGKHFAYALGNRVAVDGRMMDIGLDAREFRFSPDGKHFAYIARGSVVYDGVAQPTGGDVAIRQLQFSPDSQRLSYVIHEFRNSTDTFVLNGKRGPVEKEIWTSAFINRGSNVLYFAYRRFGTGYNWCAVKDGIAGPALGAIPRFAATPDGSHYAYFTSKRDAAGEKFFMFVDGQPGPPFELVYGKAPVFDADGSIRYAVRNAGNYFRVKQKWNK